MKILRGGLLIILYSMATIVCLGIVFSPIVWSWLEASQQEQVIEGRMRWCIVAKTPIVKGVKLTDENVDWTIRRVRTGDHFIPDAKRAVGKYALVDLNEDELLNPEYLSEFALSEAPNGGAAVLVEVKTEHTIGLRPGMRLALVQEKEKERVMIPESKELIGQTIEPGFMLLSVAISPKDASIAALTIAVAKSDLDYIPDLASGQWRPVILSAPK